MFCISLPGLLTKKFINLIKRAEDGVLDLNKAAETLEVSVTVSLSAISHLLMRCALLEDMMLL